MHKWLVFGCRGWIGSKIVDEIEDVNPSDTVIHYPHRVLSYKDVEPIRRFIEDHQITRVLDCLGKTSGPGQPNIDYLKGRLAENLQNNLLAHIVIMQACARATRFGLHLSVLGTGCIYDQGVFEDDDLPNYDGSEYSAVKGVLDQMIHLYRSQVSICHFKIRMPIDNVPHPRNLITKLAGYKSVTFQTNSMSVLPDLVPIMVKFAIAGLEGNYNMVNRGSMTHEQIMKLYVRHVDPSHTFSLLSPEGESKILSQGRCNNVMTTDKTEHACQKLGIPGPGKLDDLMNECLLHYGRQSAAPFRRILVTGANGFIASHLLRMLHEKYPHAKLVNIDKAQSFSWDRSHWKNYVEINADIADAHAMDQAFQQHQFDTVFHLAAETHVDTSFENSLDFTHSNVLGTHTLLEQCRKHQCVKRFLHMSTDEVYGGSSELKTETSAPNPTNPYAATKVAAEALCQAYIKSFHLPIVIVRCNNVFGEHQLPEKVIPRFICRRILGSLPLQIQGDGSALRSFVYVEDVVRALHLVASCGELYETYNIDSADEISVKALAEKICKLIPGSAGIETVADRKFQDVRYHIDASKIRRLGWTQTTTFDAGLAKCIQWYQDFINVYPRHMIVF